MKESDLKTGRIVQLRNGDYYVVVNEIMYNKLGQDIVNNFYDTDLKHIHNRDLDIMKVYENPEIVLWERPTEILNEQERKYLSALLKPFKYASRYVAKVPAGHDFEYLSFKIGEEGFKLPLFQKGAMYKAMELRRRYSLKELGLEE